MTKTHKTFGEVFDAHTDAEFRTRDIEATMATMSGNAHVIHVGEEFGDRRANRGAIIRTK